MSTETQAQVSAQQIASFLEQNPDFFDTYPNLLADIRVQHESGKAVSLIEKQVAVLREQKKKLKKQLQELLEVARENDELDRRVHQLTLRLIECRSPRAVLDALTLYLTRDFGADAVTVRLRTPPPGTTHIVLPEFESGAELAGFDKAIQDNKPLCGRFKPEQVQYLFGAKAEGIESAALVPLNDDVVFGLLAIGARDAQRFHADQGTLFLIQLGELTARVLRAGLRESP